MNEVPGTTGYGEQADRYAELTEVVSFDRVHRSFLPYLPAAPSRVLDVGAGTGRDAAVLADRGHSVTAVEPCDALRSVGIRRYRSSEMVWLDDALPDLTAVRGEFDFILASSVWHHLMPEGQRAGVRRVSELLAGGGVFAMSLRNGPAGIGTHVFATDAAEVTRAAEAEALDILVHEPDEPSLLPGKPLVKWTRLAFRKTRSAD